MLITCKNCGRSEYTQGDYPDTCEYCGEDPRVEKKLWTDTQVKLRSTADLDRFQRYYPANLEYLCKIRDEEKVWWATQDPETRMVELGTSGLELVTDIPEKDLWEMFKPAPQAKLRKKVGKKAGKKKSGFKKGVAYLDTSIGRVKVQVAKVGATTIDWDVSVRYPGSGIYYRSRRTDLCFTTRRWINGSTDIHDIHYSDRNTILKNAIEAKIKDSKGDPNGSK